MKFTKSLIILLILTLSQCSLVKRTERKANNKVKNDGSGTWTGGYECPGIQLLEETDLKQADVNGKWTAAERVTFKADDIQNPKNDNHKLGIFFTIANPSEKLRSILVPSGQNTFYLPFRSVSSKFSFKNPFYDYKVIEGSVTNDVKKTFLFRLKLPYKTMGWYISDQEMQTLCQLINDKRDGEQTIVKNTKSNLLKESGLYINNKSTLNEVSKNGTDKAAAKAALTAKSQSLKSTIDTENNNLNALNIEIAKINAELNQKKIQYDDLNNKINSLGMQHQEILNQIAQLDGDQATIEKMKNELTEKSNTYQTNLNAAVEVLVKKVPNKTNDINQAKTEVTTDNKSDKLNQVLGAIYP
jgi:hypothetical protein